MAGFGFFGKGGRQFGGNIIGGDITINGRKIFVDGKLVTDEAEGVIELRIIGADAKINSIDTTCSIHITGDVEGKIKAGMNVECGNVTGNVDAGMKVTCGNVGGDVDSDMNVRCGTIGGSAEADMNIDCDGDIKGSAKAGMSVRAKTVGS